MEKRNWKSAFTQRTNCCNASTQPSSARAIISRRKRRPKKQESKMKKRINFWPFAIIGWFIIFATFIAIFGVFAARQKVDLVRTDYYDAEIRFQKQIERQERT